MTPRERTIRYIVTFRVDFYLFDRNIFGGHEENNCQLKRYNI